MRCAVCRTRRSTWALMAAHQQQHDHRGPCQCGGYAWPHRPGSPCCDHNPLAALHRAQREGACDDDLAELYWHLPGRPSEACPF